MEMLFTVAIIVLFTALYFILASDEQCYYRRYILPAMFLFLALIHYDDTLTAVSFAAAAAFVYFGQKGYGQQKIKNPEKDESEEKEKQEEEK